MDPIIEWTGRLAHALQRALRMNNETFGEALGVHARTVDGWRIHPDRVPNVELQQALDTMLDRADDRQQRRFQLIVSDENGPTQTAPPTAESSVPTSTPAVEHSQTAPPSGTLPPEPAREGDSFVDWLQVAHEVSAPPDGSDIGQILKWYRRHQNLTQQEAASLLNTNQSRLSRIEKGSQELVDVNELRRIARILGIPPSRLGVLTDHSHDATPQPAHVSHSPGPVRESQEHWREVRRELNANRALLGHMAADLYKTNERLADAAVLTGPGWVPDHPIDITDIGMRWIDDPPTPTVTGSSDAAIGTRPLSADGQSYGRYSRALRDLAKPRLLDNRVSYRLLDVSGWADPSLSFSYTSYFDTLDIGEPLGHEFAEAWINNGRRMPTLANLPFRRVIENPFDLAARPMLPSINTLTIRRDSIDGHRMYLHLRDPNAVAAAGGSYHVSPAGVFQPAAIAPVHQANDFSLWRNVQREYAEEFLGLAEHDGNSSDPIQYESDEPFRSFEEARRAGDFRVYVFAVVLEPLTLWVELITIAIISAPAFDRLFGGMVSVNEEGAAVSLNGQPTSGIPFTTEAIQRLESAQLSPISRACIQQAWKYRHDLLDT